MSAPCILRENFPSVQYKAQRQLAETHHTSLFKKFCLFVILFHHLHCIIRHMIGRFFSFFYKTHSYEITNSHILSTFNERKTTNLQQVLFSLTALKKLCVQLKEFAFTLSVSVTKNTKFLDYKITKGFQ